MAQAQPSSTYSGDELRAMLTAGAAGASPTLQAAVHLLTFTDVPDRPAFANLVDVDDISAGTTPALGAFVRDWAGLPSSAAAARLSGGPARLLALAISLATGQPVDLRENIAPGGHAHIRRVLEAVIIAAADGLYEVAPTPKLDEVLAFHQSMQR
jgi:hypothetical protein